MNLTKILEDQMTSLIDALTKPRPISFVRKLQSLFLLMTLAFVTYILVSPYLGKEKLDISQKGPFAVGNQAPETITSNKDIIYDDEEKTKSEKLKAYQSGAFIFERDYKVLSDTITLYIEEDFENLRVLSTDQNYTSLMPILLSKIPRWKKRPKEDIIALIDYPQKDILERLVIKGTSLLFSTNCILKDEHPDINLIASTGGTIYNKANKDQISLLNGANIFHKNLIYDKNAKLFEHLSSQVEKNLDPMDETTARLVKRLSVNYAYSFPACTYNEEETIKEKIAKQNKVSIVKSRILNNEIIVRKGELITPEIIKKLSILNKYGTRANILSILSILIIQIVCIGIIIVFLKKYDNRRLNDVSSNVIIFSLLWTIVWAAYIASKFFYNIENTYESMYYLSLFVPIGFICLMIGFIFDEQLSIAMGFYLSIFLFMASRNNPTSFMIAITTTIIASVYGRKLSKRIDFIKSGLYISGIQILIATSGYLMDSRQYWVSNSTGSFLNDFYNSNIFKLYVVCLINGFLSITAAQILLPIYEYIFNVPTRFKLIELADTGHPLLQSLLTQAPSTYTHTFMVAALSERAAQNLKLDWLLTRVGVYYHDIGKIPNAGFFIENQHLIPKPEHIDKNNPGLAAKIVIDHVIDGIEMAKKARLPREVINFIPEHHGTSTMAFFYHKALVDLTPEQRENIQKKDFMYPGPKPQRKETGIVMIADSVEAASRSLDSVTPEAIDNLIQKIINSKLSENQLDESGLTIGDLVVIKNSFKEILLSSLHSRPKYPKPEETLKLESQIQHRDTKPIESVILPEEVMKEKSKEIIVLTPPPIKKGKIVSTKKRKTSKRTKS